MKKLLILIFMCSLFNAYAVDSLKETTALVNLFKDTRNMSQDELSCMLKSYKGKILHDAAKGNWEEFNSDYFLMSCIFIIQTEKVISGENVHINAFHLEKLLYEQIDFMNDLFGNHKIPYGKFSFDTKKLRSFLESFSQIRDNKKLYSLETNICIDYMNALQAFLRYSEINGIPPETLDELYPAYTTEKFTNSDISLKNGEISLCGKFSVNRNKKYLDSDYWKHISKSTADELVLRNINTDVFNKFLKREANVRKIVISNSTIDFGEVDMPESLKELFVSNSSVENLHSMSKLEYLGLSNCDLEGQIALDKEYPDLKGLSISHSNLKNIKFVSFLTGLKFLDLNNTQIDDLNPIGGLSNLEDLRFGNTNATNLDFISCKLILKHIFFPYTNISDISPLFALKKLESVNMMFTKVDRSQYEELKKIVNSVDWVESK